MGRQLALSTLGLWAGHRGSVWPLGIPRYWAPRWVTRVTAPHGGSCRDKWPNTLRTGLSHRGRGPLGLECSGKGRDGSWGAVGWLARGHTVTRGPNSLRPAPQPERRGRGGGDGRGPGSPCPRPPWLPEISPRRLCDSSPAVLHVWTALGQRGSRGRPHLGGELSDPPADLGTEFSWRIGVASAALPPRKLAVPSAGPYPPRPRRE